MDWFRLHPIRLLGEVKSHKLTLDEQGFLLQSCALIALFDGALTTDEPEAIFDEIRPRISRKRFGALWDRCYALLVMYEGDTRETASKCAEKSSKRSDAARARWDANASRRKDAPRNVSAHAIADANASPTFHANADADKKRVEEKRSPLPPKGDDGLFPTFWSSYPRHVGKAAALKAFARLKVTPSLLQSMLDALAWQRQQDGWTKDGGAFIPHPSTWLNQRRWEDERPAGAAGQPASDDGEDDGPWYPSLRDYVPGGPQR